MTRDQVMQQERAHLGDALNEARRAAQDLRAGLLQAEAALKHLGEASDAAAISAACELAQRVLPAALRLNADATEALCSLQVLAAVRRVGDAS